MVVKIINISALRTYRPQIKGNVNSIHVYNIYTESDWNYRTAMPGAIYTEVVTIISNCNFARLEGRGGHCTPSIFLCTRFYQVAKYDRIIQHTHNPHWSPPPPNV